MLEQQQKADFKDGLKGVSTYQRKLSGKSSGILDKRQMVSDSDLNSYFDFELDQTVGHSDEKYYQYAMK